MTSRLVTFLVVLITACGPMSTSLESSLEPVVVTPRGSGADDGGVARDAGVNAGRPALDAGTSDGGPQPLDAGTSDAGAAANDVGTISISVEANAVRLSASFFSFSSTPSCTERAAGACSVRSCTGRGSHTAELAGTVTLSARGQQAVATMDSNGNYSATLPVTVSAGDLVTVAADGDTVPAFSVSARTPVQTRITSPVCAPFVECAGIERQTAPTFQWQPTPDSVFTTTFMWQDSRGNHLATCAAPSSTGTATIDATAWSAIPSTETLMLLATIDARTVSHAGSWELTTMVTAAETMVVIE